MNKQNQNGSAAVVIIVILLVVIVGVLGFVLWQNLTTTGNKSAQDVSKNNDENEPVVKSKTAQIDASFPANLSWTYPESWTIKSEGGGPKNDSDTAVQKFTLTSPNGRYDVIYNVGFNAGLGGSCQPGGDALQSVGRTVVPGFEKSVFMEAIAEADKGFKYNSGLFQNNIDVQNVKTGDSFCKIYLKNVIPLTEDGKMVILAAEVNIKELDSFDEYGPTEIYPNDISTIEEAFEDPEYKDAVKILLSTASK